MSTLVLTGYDDAMQELGDICLPSKRAYAERHGYAFECVREYPNDVHPSWHKLQLLKDRIDRYDAILWLDADTIVTNTAIRFFYRSPSTAYDGPVLMASQDWCAPAEERPNRANGISFGNFILRNTPDTHAWLDMASQHTQYATRSTCCWEQDSVNKCMRENPWFRSQVLVMERRALNSVHETCEITGVIKAPDPWQPGDFLIHLTGVSNRIELAKQFARLVSSA